MHRMWTGEAKRDHAITKLGGHYGTCPNYPVKCIFECGKTVQRKNVLSHISGGEYQIETALYKTTDCTNGCKQQMEGKDLSKHLRNKCFLRMHKCEHCGYEKTYLAVMNHYGTCDNYPLPCHTGCYATIMRKDITAHQNECPHVKNTAHQNECSYVK